MLRLPLLLIISNLLCAQAAPPVSEAFPPARALFKQGKFHEAAAAYRTILEKDRSSAPAYAGLVESYLKADEVSAADEASAQAMIALPQSAVVHTTRGDVFFRKGLLAEAENEYTSALKLDENCAHAWLGEGKILSAVGDSRGARFSFAKAHELDPDDEDALYHWAVLLPYPKSVKELERHLAEFHSTPEDERREREFIELVKGIGLREVWVPQRDLKDAEIKLELLAPRAGTVLGLGIRVKFNNSVNGTLLLDTGAAWMTIPRKLAEKIGARKISDYGIEGVGDSGPAAGYFAWVDKITVGAVEFHDCVVHVALKGDMAGEDGVAGTNIFSNYQVTVDFPGRKLRVAQPEPQSIRLDTPSPAKRVADHLPGTTFSFGHIVLVTTLVNNSSLGLFVLDSGANSRSISPSLAKSAGELQESKNRVSGIGGEISRVAVLPNANLKFSESAGQKRDLMVFDRDQLSRQLGTEVSGFIGFDVLSHLKIRIDYRDGHVDFEQPGK